MALTAPIADWALVYSVDPATGQLVVDMGLTAARDLQLVVGIQRLQQDVLRWLLTPQGTDFDPGFGNPLFGVLGSPTMADPSEYEAMVEQAQVDFIQRQALAAAQGYLDDTEMVAAFTDVHVDLSVPGSVSVSFTIQTRAGQSARLLAPFQISIAA